LAILQWEPQALLLAYGRHIQPTARVYRGDNMPEGKHVIYFDVKSFVAHAIDDYGNISDGPIMVAEESKEPEADAKGEPRSPWEAMQDKTKAQPPQLPMAPEGEQTRMFQ
jgi:type I site-specific restriction-modification system R (restriction) subunit